MLGFKFTYAPDLDNQWQAISAISEILGVIVSSFLTGLIIIQTNKINKRSKKQANKLAKKEQQTRRLELKISLYDKRYAIYERIYPYTERLESAIQFSKQPLPDGSHVDSKDLVIESLMNSATRTHTKEHIAKLTSDIEKAETNEKIQKLTNERGKLLSDLQMEKFKFLSHDQAVIMLAEFCYPKEIAIPIIKYFEIIFSWYFSDGTTTEDDVLSNLKELHKMKIFQKMKSLLTLSYENQSSD